MKKERKKNGFTLIEILAVIVILAIIALIATPIMLGVIENARRKAFEDTGYGIVESIRGYYVDKLTEEGIVGNNRFTFPKSGLKFTGTDPAGGNAILHADGKIEIAIHNNRWCVTKGADEDEVTSVDYVEGECKLPEKKNVLDSDWWYLTDESIDKYDIEKITLSVSGDKPNSLFSWDVSEDQDKGIMAYYIGDPEDDELDEIMIVGNGNIYAPESSNVLFGWFSNTTEMLNFDLLNTSKVTDMRAMFEETDKLVILDVSKFSMDQVEDVYSMFCGSGVKEEDILKLDNFKSLSENLRSDLFTCVMVS